MLKLFSCIYLKTFYKPTLTFCYFSQSFLLFSIRAFVPESFKKNLLKCYETCNIHIIKTLSFVNITTSCRIINSTDLKYYNIVWRSLISCLIHLKALGFINIYALFGDNNVLVHYILLPLCLKLHWHNVISLPF